MSKFAALLLTGLLCGCSWGVVAGLFGLDSHLWFWLTFFGAQLALVCAWGAYPTGGER